MKDIYMPAVEIVSRANLSAERYADIVGLCERAYEEPFAELMTSFADAVHVLATAEGVLVSHALWVPRTLYTGDRVLHCAYVEAVATEPVYQGRGYASAVLRQLAAAIGRFDVGVLSPSDPAFYERLSWECWRGPLAVRLPEGDAPTPDEEVMILRLPGAAALDVTQPLIATWRDGDVW